ncbi:hypothetical protein G5B40_19395 [Pikeienuella piscinae]|uniref:Uncharacterized protein n=1 Tax=Pikeienuella piscinae TaxID=2748098 RepID=A0A7M3T5Y9_9RHOB|nr:hypothetical protein [Pikeienuella piscinae]QIE57420.1 hypothetical protein G5B40_19395 [Pikeienuella piscinae]
MRADFEAPAESAHGWSELDAMQCLPQCQDGITPSGFKPLKEIGDVQDLADALGLNHHEISLVRPGNDPPDAIRTVGERIIGVEHRWLTNRQLRKGRDALRKGKPVHGVSFHEKLEPRDRGIVWNLSESQLRNEILESIARKERDLCRWPDEPVLSERWLVLVLEDSDHQRCWEEVENWAKRIETQATEFDAIYLLQGYDPTLGRHRAIQILGR